MDTVHRGLMTHIEYLVELVLFRGPMVRIDVIG